MSEGDKTRVEKTDFISTNIFVKKHLYVCWKEIFKNEWPQYWNDIKDSALKNRNCTKCDKCMRTCLTLDLLGHLDDYNELFDLPQYYKARNSYVRKVYANRNNNSIYHDIYNLMVEKNAHISFSVRVLSLFANFKQKMTDYAKMLLIRNN